MIAITSVSVVSTGEGNRIVVTYSEIGNNGEFLSQNKKKNYIATEQETLSAIEAIRADAMKHIEG